MTDEKRFDAQHRVVIKVGSSSLAPRLQSEADVTGPAASANGDDRHSGVDHGLITSLTSQIAALRSAGTEVVLVSSGAVAAGLAPLGLTSRPRDLPGLQAAASVGQGLLMHTYQQSFAEHGLVGGQVLLTPEDVTDRPRYLNARHTLETLLGLGAVPVVNENDTVATEELRFGDNDRLAALAASMLGAGLLLLLSDVDGLYDGDPSTGYTLTVLDRVDDVGAMEPRQRGPAGSGLGRGGMASKLEAARMATLSAAHTVIANARRPGVVADVAEGGAVGTWFPPQARRPDSRKLWLALARTPRGTLVVDSGAVQALRKQGSSLLAAGIAKVSGEFEAGDLVDIVGPDELTVGRGLVAYDSQELTRVQGRSTGELVTKLGAGYERAVVHRDSMLVLAS